MFTSGRYQRDTKIPKIFASDSKHFRVCGILKKLQIDDDKGGGVVVVTTKHKSFIESLK